jgi:hypothetical protein
MSSRLISEDEQYLILERYIHDDTDEFSYWELDKEANPKYSQVVQDAEHYVAYELKIKYRIDKKTGEVLYLEFDGMGLPT